MSHTLLTAVSNSTNLGHVSSPKTPVCRTIRGRRGGRAIGTPVRPEPSSSRNQCRIQPHFSRNDFKSNTPWTKENSGPWNQGSDVSSPDEFTVLSRSSKCLSSTEFGVTSRGPSDEQELSNNECTTGSEGTSTSSSFENLFAPNQFSGTTASSEDFLVLPLVGPRPRLDGMKHYDLVCERDPLLLSYGFVSQDLWTIEERLFNDPELDDRQKAMNALWTRWLALYRIDFIENPTLCCTNFVEHKYEIIHHAAGWHAFRSWILAIKYNNYLTQDEMISIIKLYNQRAAQVVCTSSLPEA